MNDYYQQLLTSQLAKGGRALIVGGAEEQFPRALRDNPRLIFWDSDSPKFRHPEIPANTRAVMLMRFIRHAVSKQLAEQAKKRNIFCFQKLNDTGEVTRMLTEALVATNPENSTIRAGVTSSPAADPLAIAEEQLSNLTPHTPSQPPIESGTITNFVRRHRPDVFQRLTSEQCDELVKVAAAEGIITTAHSIKGIYYLLRSRAKTTKPAAEVIVDPVPEPQPPPPPLPILPPLTDDSSHTVKLLTRLTQFADLFDVVGELHMHVEAVLKENAELLKYKTKYLKMIDAANDVEVGTDVLST